MMSISDSPLWQNDPAWRDNQIASTARGELATRWLFAVAFTGVSVPLVMVLPEELEDGNWPALLALLFPLVGLLMLRSAVTRTIDWRRIGRLALALDPFPGSLGGDVGGTVDIPVRFAGGRRFRVALACSRLYETGSGDSRSTQEKVLWDRNGIAEVKPSLTGTRLAFRFRAPDDMPESEEKSDDYRRWAVRITDADSAKRFDRTFVIPVFRTGDVESAARLADSHEALVDVAFPDIPTGHMRIERTPYGLELRFRAFRHWPAKLMLGVVGAICLGVASVMVGSAGDMFNDVGSMIFGAFGAIFVIVFGLVGLLTSAMFVWELGNGLTTRITRQELSTERRLFGITISRRSMPAPSLKRLEWKVGMRAGRGAGSTKFQRLIGHDSTGGKITLAEGVRDPVMVRHLEELIARACHFDAAKS
jgi:hypothetical protein